MNKQEQKTIIDTIELIFNEKISKLSTELENEKKNRIMLKEKNSILETENKTLKIKIKELEKELNTTKKEATKYNKLVSSLKK